MVRSRGLVLTACLLIGCGPKPEAKAPPPKARVRAAQIAEERPDLAPVKQPDAVVLVGRIARPRLFADTVTRWSSLPVGLEDRMPEQARPLGRAVLWEAPVELLVEVDAFGVVKV